MKILKFYNQFLNEQATEGDKKYLAELEEEYKKKGFIKANEINLPDGSYLGNPDGCEQLAEQTGLNHSKNLLIYKSGNFTGYVLIVENPSRSGYKNVNVNIKGKKHDFKEKISIVVYKDPKGLKVNTTNPSETETSNEIKSVVKKEGIKNVTEQMIQTDYRKFPGEFSPSMLKGSFIDGKTYIWDCTGIEGIPTDSLQGWIVTDYSEAISKMVSEYKDKDGNPLKIDDIKPQSVCVGLHTRATTKFVLYTSTSGKIKGFSYR